MAKQAPVWEQGFPGVETRSQCGDFAAVLDRSASSPSAPASRSDLSDQRRAAGRGALLYEDFDQPAPLKLEEQAPSFSLADIETARAEAYRHGHDAAAAEAAAASQTSIQVTLHDIAAQLIAARDLVTERAEQSAAAIAQLLLHSLGVLLPQLAARYGETELRAMVAAILPGLFKEPAVTVRLNPRHHDDIKHEIEQFDPDLAARVQLVPNELMPPGDIHIAWRDGEATRDIAALWSQIAETLGLSGLAPSALPVGMELENAG